MNLTPEQLRQNAAAMLAYADGKPVQYKESNAHVWCDCSRPGWYLRECEYRPKPEPKTRPWSKPSDVPAFCWIRFHEQSETCALVVGVSTRGVCGWEDDPAEAFVPWDKISVHEYSTDRVTWHKCEVVEP